MIAEQRKCGGREWQLYDSAFRQQITSLEGTDISRLNQLLYSTTFLIRKAGSVLLKVPASRRNVHSSQAAVPLVRLAGGMCTHA